ncbi:GFA family protein [Ferrimonas lipolytica]|uniref:GFA family protein n=1 Tax=Ferrimonas lipolytica TaxID=2724191 RepID=A0A6H1UCV6_9GAMM|nr:GFA family protein [Ferrimonas lipolytica]QIZ76937.1 GFA family protein [Ferrimonas lipolytica]
MAKVLTGGCLCGAIRYQTTAEPFDADHCHCRQCQRGSGGILNSWMDFKAEQINWLNQPPREFASSAKIHRGFCSTCGSTISYRHSDYPHYLTLTIASLDNPNHVKPNYHIFTASQPDWLSINDDCPRYKHQRTKPSSN